VRTCVPKKSKPCCEDVHEVKTKERYCCGDIVLKTVKFVKGNEESSCQDEERKIEVGIAVGNSECCVDCCKCETSFITPVKLFNKIIDVSCLLCLDGWTAYKRDGKKLVKATVDDIFSENFVGYTLDCGTLVPLTSTFNFA